MQLAFCKKALGTGEDGAKVAVDKRLQHGSHSIQLAFCKKALGTGKEECRITRGIASETVVRIVCPCPKPLTQAR